MVAIPGSNFSVVNGLDGATKVPISTPVNDTNGNTVVAHLGMTVAAGIATPISGSNPVPISATALPLPTGAAQDGTDATGVAPPAGAAGIRGWLSGIYARLSGTITVAFATAQAVTQSGTWTVGISGTPTVSVNGTLPVSAAALPLPAGAATAANQAAPGTAGSPSAAVMTVQGIANGTALVVSGGANAGNAPSNPPVSVAGVDSAGNKQHILLDTSGRQLIIQGGGAGNDYSAGGAAAAATAGNLLVTIPATASRAFVEVQNQSGGTVSLVRDDGAGNNQTLILLASGGSAGSQGAGWSSATFKGRVRVYGTTGAQVAAYQE